MTAGSGREREIREQIAAVREFNRFYTARLGLLRRRHLDGAFSLTEARILYEIGSEPVKTASDLRATLELDRGYMSRLLAGLTRRKLVRQTASKADGREKHLSLTATGERARARLNEQSTEQLRKVLANVDAERRATLVASLRKAQQILKDGMKPAVRIERLVKPCREAREILEEYYEAVHVVLRDGPGSLQKLMDDSASGMWLAWMGDEVVGCVALRRLAGMEHASECKRLYVKPSARGHRIADRLMDALEAFAREQSVRWIYLDSYDDLKAAITLYERRGYERCERYNDNPQATLFMRKRIG